ncbi:hypothetical protein FRC12_023097 [Ceratobasidium sp. 428]|nr:hypothetical protein FRC12_023097 [Ceratobasidium sp. 428]
MQLKRILRFDPSRLIGKEKYIQRKALKRWSTQMGIQYTDRSNATDLLEPLKLAVLELDRLGVELWWQPEPEPGGKEADMPIKRVSNLVLEKLRNAGDMRPQYKRNKCLLKMALKNIIILKGFYLEKFMSQSRPPKIKNGKPFVKNAPEIVLTRKKGPCIVASEDGYILILYIPKYVQAESETLMRRTLEDFTDLVPPKRDTKCGDRRANFLTAPAKQVERDWAEYLGEPAPDSEAEEEEGTWDAPYPNPDPFRAFPEETDQMDPAALHHCLNWIARGQQGRKPPVVSTELRAALANEAKSAAFLAHHVGRSLTDNSLNDLMRLFHPVFYHLLCQLRDKLFNAENPPPVSWDAWSSIFSFQSIGFNRQTRMHRDPAGMHGGLDVLFLLGDHTGGRMKWQDLNVKADWLPGDLCAFDGKVFSHGIEEWKGSKRYCFIYFVHRNVFSHFGLPSSCCFPSVSELRVSLGMSDDSKKQDESD